MLKGVEKVESGYARPVRGKKSGASNGESRASNGAGRPPTYEEVSTGTTGYAEVIRITYDPSIISYDDLLTVFFGSHDPTTPNRQGADVGEQYRSIIFYQTEEEKKQAEKKIKEINESLKDGTRVVTDLVPFDSPAGEFYKAEDYHQNYYKTNTSAPYCQLVIEPKIQKVRKRFAELLRVGAE